MEWDGSAFPAAVAMLAAAAAAAGTALAAVQEQLAELEVRWKPGVRQEL